MLYSPSDDGLAQQVCLKNGEVAHIRPLVSPDDILACEKLQTETWGDGPHAGLIAHSVLGVIPSVGGLVAGAFVQDVLQACLISFSGFSKVSDRVHWSSRLAVTPRYRDTGLGYAMKQYQRLSCKMMGVTSIYWTYDPLESRNAHFNINKLGVDIESYRPNAYGLSESPLHQGIGTDRFVVKWPVATPIKRAAWDLSLLPEPMTLDLLEVGSSPFKVMIPDAIQDLKNTHPPMRLLTVCERERYFRKRSSSDIVCWDSSVRIQVLTIF